MGPDPEIFNLENAGVRTTGNFVNSVFCSFSPGRAEKMLPRKGFSKPGFGQSAGSGRLDWPHCQIQLLFGGFICIKQQVGMPSKSLLDLGNSWRVKGALMSEVDKLTGSSLEEFQNHRGLGRFFFSLLGFVACKKKVFYKQHFPFQV